MGMRELKAAQAALSILTSLGTIPDLAGPSGKILSGTVKPVTAKKIIGRNNKCFCGSGKKFKHCCIEK